MSETDELTALVARLEAWVEAAMLLLAGATPSIGVAGVADGRRFGSMAWPTGLT
jgi:hypothetical protein